MSELEDKLGALLSDPDSMAQVMQLAQQLSSSFGAQEQAPPKPQPPTSETPNLGALLGGIDPNLITKFLPLLQEYGKSNSQTMQLLYALRPYLKPERQNKIERAAKLARVIHIGKMFLSDMGGLDHV